MRYLGRQESLETQEYRSGNFISNINDLYTGKADLKIEASSEDMIEMIAEDDNGGNKIKVIRGQKITKYINLDKLYPNQCCTLHFEDDVRYTIYKKSKNIFRIVDQRPDPNFKNNPDKIVARNMEHCYFEALARDKSITMISVSGDAGTAKTSMVAKATLDILAKKGSMRATIFRPIVDNGEKLGFLPGGLDEKTGPYLQPVANAFRHVASDGKSSEAGPPIGSMEHDMSMKNGNANLVDVYIGSGRISLESINFVQGVTLHNTVMVQDEAQDFKEGEMEITLTRIGKNGKIFLTGDLNQLHRPFLQPTASGFVWAIENLKHSERAAHITFTEVFRNPFVEEISNLRKN
jgi:predicted ribonuclease YlaK